MINQCFRILLLIFLAAYFSSALCQKSARPVGSKVRSVEPLKILKIKESKWKIVEQKFDLYEYENVFAINDIRLRSNNIFVYPSEGGKLKLSYRSNPDLNSKSEFQLNELKNTKELIENYITKQHIKLEFKETDVIFHYALFNEGEISNINLDGFINAKIACPDGVIRPVRSYKLENGSSELLIEFKEGSSIFLPIKNNRDIRSLDQIKRLRYIPLDSHKIKLLSLVNNSATNSMISKYLSASKIKFEYKSHENLRQAIKENADNPTFLLGHQEKGSIVEYNSKNIKVFEIKISEISGIAKEYNANVFLIGCQTFISSEQAVGGTLTPINTVNVVKRFRNALIDSKNNTVHLTSSIASRKVVLGCGQFRW